MNNSGARLVAVGSLMPNYCQGQVQPRCNSYKVVSPSASSAPPSTDADHDTWRKHILRDKDFSSERHKLEQKLGQSNGALDVREESPSSEAGYGRTFSFAVPAGGEAPVLDVARFGRERDGSSFVGTYDIKQSSDRTLRIETQEFDLQIRNENGRQLYTVRLKNSFVGGLKINSGQQSQTIWTEGSVTKKSAPDVNPTQVPSPAEPVPEESQEAKTAEPSSNERQQTETSTPDLSDISLPKVPTPPTEPGNTTTNETTSGETPGAEVSTSDARVAAVEAELASTRAELEQTRAEVERARAEAESVGGEVEELEVELSALRTELQDHQSADVVEDATYEAQISELEDQRNTAEEERDAAREERDHTTAELEESRTGQETQNVELSRLQQALASALEKHGSDAEVTKALQEQVQQLQTQLEKAGIERSELARGHREELEKDATEDQEREAALAEAEKQTQELRDERDRVKEELKTRQQKMRIMSQNLSEVVEERDATAEELRQQKEALERMRQQLEQLQESLSGRAELEAENQRLQEELEGVQAQAAPEQEGETIELDVIMPSGQGETSSGVTSEPNLPSDESQRGSAGPERQEDPDLVEIDFSQKGEEPQQEADSSPAQESASEPELSPEEERLAAERKAREEELQRREEALKRYNDWMKENNIREELSDPRLIESFADRTRSDERAFELTQTLESMQERFIDTVQRRSGERDQAWSQRFNRLVDIEIENELDTIRDSYAAPGFLSGIADSAAGMFGRDAETAYSPMLKARLRALYTRSQLEGRVAEAQESIRK